MNDKLTQLRRDLQREAEVMNRNVLKGTRWLLVKHPDHLDDSKNERVRLQEALDLNRSLAAAYYLKEDLSRSGNSQPKPSLQSS
ncbi:MAG: transposase [Planctomycetaceae bacterium]